MSRADVHTLPSEVLSLILSRLDPLSLHRVSLASKQMRQAAALPALWEEHCDCFWPSGSRGGAKAESQQWEQWRQRRWRDGLHALVERQRERQEQPEESEGQSFALSLELLTGSPSDSRPPLPNFHARFQERMQRDHDLLGELRALIVEGDQGASSSGSSSTPRRHLAAFCRLALMYGQDVRDILHKLAWDQTVNADNVDEVMARFRTEDVSSWPTAYDLHARLSDSQGVRRPHKDYHLALHHFAHTLLGHLQRAEGLEVFRQIRERDSHLRYDEQVMRAQTACDRDGGARQRAMRSTEEVEVALSALACFRGGDRAEISRYLDVIALSCYFSLRPGSESMTSLRAASRQIMAHLQQLGGGIADPLNFLDIDNSFLHISIMCPDNRATLPLTLTLIFCAVARRLGIAAALCNTPGRIVAVVEGDAATESSDDTKMRRQFYIDASQEDPVRENLQNFTAEGGAAYNAALASIDWKPASPADLIRRCAHNILNAVQNGRGIPRVIHVHTARARRNQDQQAAQQGSSDDVTEHKEGASTPAQEVLKYLSSHPKDHHALFSQGALPAFLNRVILSTTPSTLPSARRASPRHEDEEDATYAAAWIMTELSPEELGARGKKWIMGQIESSYPLDVLLCPGGQTEMNKLSMAQQRAERHRERHGTSGVVPAVRLEEEEEEEEDLQQEATSSPASSDSEDFDEGDTDRIFRTHARQLFQNDSLPAEVHSRPLPAGQTSSDVFSSHDTTTTTAPSSVSASVSASSGTARAQEQAQEQDPVLHTVGTLMKHRQYGYRAVIVGWDRVCSASPRWIQQMGVDQLEGGGRTQPFYHAVVDDGSRRYVARCNVVPLRPSRIGGGGGGGTEGATSAAGTQAQARARVQGPARAYPQEEGEDIEDFIQVLNVRGIGREFRAADAARCRLRKNATLRAAFPDDASGDEG